MGKQYWKLWKSWTQINENSRTEILNINFGKIKKKAGLKNTMTRDFRKVRRKMNENGELTSKKIFEGSGVWDVKTEKIHNINF